MRERETWLDAAFAARRWNDAPDPDTAELAKLALELAALDFPNPRAARLASARARILAAAPGPQPAPWWRRAFAAQWSMAMAAAGVAAVALLGGLVSATALSAPGDTLHDLKRTGQSVMVSFAVTPEREADMALAVAAARVEELVIARQHGRPIPLSLADDYARFAHRALSAAQQAGASAATMSAIERRVSALDTSLASVLLTDGGAEVESRLLASRMVVERAGMLAEQAGAAVPRRNSAPVGFRTSQAPGGAQSVAQPGSAKPNRGATTAPVAENPSS